MPHAGRPGAPGWAAIPYGYPGFAAGVWYDWPYGYSPYGYPWPAPYPFPMSDVLAGSVRVDVSPKNADVYVDGFYAGIVSDFNGIFHHLTMTAGPHVIEMRKTGLEPLAVEIYVQPNHTITYRAAMQSVQAGSAADETESGLDTPAAVGTTPAAVPGDLYFDVTPKDARVYIDGYYVGTVGDWDGRRQRLTLASGAHHVELQAADYEPVQFDITIESRQTTTYRTAMTRVKP